MRTAEALLCLLFSTMNKGNNAAPAEGSKCGVNKVSGPLVHTLRVVGGAEATHGSHPWLVSLRRESNHFCGGAILTDSWIMTAAHCFSSPPLLRGVRVVIGDLNQQAPDEEEQVLGVKSISVHDKHHSALPMNYDIALLELDQPIRFGEGVGPVCLPLPDDDAQPEAGCIVGGWGRTTERGLLSSTLREVQLNLVDPAQCRHVLQTVKSAIFSPQRLRRPQPALTVLCAGPETGGRDACQGDSGGPLVCPAGSGGGHWVAVGVTSWGKGCGRRWDSNLSRPPSRRGSPGVFTDVKLMLSWIKMTLRQAEAKRSGRPFSRLCSVRDGFVSDHEGVIRNPAPQDSHYDNNELCVWTLSVASGYSILLEIEHLDLENDSHCLFDRLTVSVGVQKPVGIFCGSVHLWKLHLWNSHHATVLFSTDVSEVGRGFSLKHRASRGLDDPGCGTVVLVQNVTSIHSPDYPKHYSNDCLLRWVVHAPQGDIVKLILTDFELEESSRCLYDFLVVSGDVEGREELAVLCGVGVPPPVISYHSVMVLQFTTDSSVTHRGFSANVEFISQSELHQVDQSNSRSHKDLSESLSSSHESQSDLRRQDHEEAETSQELRTKDDLIEESSGTDSQRRKNNE